MNNMPEIIANTKLGIEGWFEVLLIHKPTGKIKKHLKFKNIITNTGLDAVGTATVNNFLTNGWAAVGAGSTTPSATDTQLNSQVGNRTQSQGFPITSNTSGFEANYDYWWNKIVRVFNSGESSGNLTEVGMFDASTGGTMWCRQLFRDELGNPTTIVKTADDELRIIYEFRLYTMKVENTQSITIKSVPTTCVTRGYLLNNINGWGTLGLSLGTYGTNVGTQFAAASTGSTMPNISGSQTGTQVAVSITPSWSTYSNGDYYRDVTLQWNPAANVPTIGSITWGNNSAQSLFITTFNPPPTKLSTERLTFVGRLSWGRV